MPGEPAKKWMDKVRAFLRLDKLPPVARKIVVTLAGGILLVLGIVMLVTPGPALLLIPLGLLLMASEYDWARQALHRLMEWGHILRQKWKNRKSRPQAT